MAEVRVEAEATVELDRLRLGVALRCDLLADIGDGLEAAYGPGAAHAVRAAERSLRRLAEGTNPVAVLLAAADETEVPRG